MTSVLLGHDYDALAARIHQENERWWVDIHTGAPIDRDVGELFMLMVSEIAEAMEGERKNLMDDHLPNRPMAEVELADTTIRILDYAGAHGIKINDLMTGDMCLPKMPEHKPAALLQIVAALVAAERNHGNNLGQQFVVATILMIERYANVHGYALYAAVEAKLVYNRTRADHSREGRLAVGGKKW